MFDFSKLIEEAIEQSGLTQSEFAEKMGISRIYLNKVKQGYEIPGASLLEKLEKINGMPSGTLLAHRALNKVEGLGINGAILSDPSILRAHGIELPIQSANLTHEQRAAARMAGERDWQALAELAIKAMGEELSRYRENYAKPMTPLTPTRGAYVLNDSGEDHPEKPKGKKGKS